MSRPLPELILDVADLLHDGRGVARHEGKAVFVTGALGGERVRAKLVRRNRRYDEAAVIEVLDASPLRVTPRCPHFGVCAGCVLQHLEPGAQIAAKQHALLENLARIGQVEPARVLEPLHGDPWGYRRRARLSVKDVRKKERVLVGFRELDGRFVADLRECHVLHPAVGMKLAALAALVQSLDGRGDIPQIEVSVGDDVAALVFRHLQPLSERDVAALVEFGRREGLAMLAQSGGPETVRALDSIDAQLGFRLPHYDVDIAFEPLDFVQVNATMNERMIEHALALLQPVPGMRVLDLFCGLGNFTLPIARSGAQVTGVEGDAGLIERARANAARNGLDVDFHAADLFRDQRDAAWAVRPCDAVLLDPPRAGAAELLEWMPRKETTRVVYVSCHPGSLARDAGTLVRAHGFNLLAAGVMDMFPHTAHVESIALFER
ncbi:MAG TPA: 23S rRNA (uracil(1939)-C(5))-methyltransferase RlmD [Candidatus Saccharimonadia bacterium]|nr:23S rRNA (uracil(1939)-C(5))-methyltransferase RlmD [Candidatus Saccharimonadia bacterium]